MKNSFLVFRSILMDYIKSSNFWLKINLNYNFKIILTYVVCLKDTWWLTAFLSWNTSAYLQIHKQEAIFSISFWLGDKICRVILLMQFIYVFIEVFNKNLRFNIPNGYGVKIILLSIHAYKERYFWSPKKHYNLIDGRKKIPMPEKMNQHHKATKWMDHNSINGQVQIKKKIPITWY